MSRLGSVLLPFALAAGFAGWAAIGHGQTHDEQSGTARPTVTAGAVPSMSFRDVVRRVAPSVVTVVSAHAAARGILGVAGNSVSVGLGSGVIIDADGFVVTNNHVIEDGTEVVVALADGSVRAARVVGADPDSDIALLKVAGGGLQPIAMGDIGEVAVGDIVLAVGNPLGVGQTVTQGIVGGLRNVAVRDRVIENIVQTDAAINMGNSGGALVDIAGRLIGINCVIVSLSGGSEGIGFAIPVDVVQEVVAVLRKSGQLPHAWLGLLMGRSSRGNGAPVLGVEPGAPSERAGLKPGDVVVSIGDKAIAVPHDVSDTLQHLTPGTPVDVCVQRDGNKSCTDVVPGARPATRGGIKVLGPVWTRDSN